MTIKELKEILNEYPDDTQIILSSDAEGNKYSPLDGYSNALYVMDTTWRGEVYSYDDADEISDGIDALVFYPVN